MGSHGSGIAGTGRGTSEVCASESGDESLRRWMQAVELGGRGEIAAALTILASLTIPGGGTGTALVSLAWSTTASLLRQAGRHDRALPLDGRALVTVGLAGAGLAEAGERADEGSAWIRAAQVDALVGLAADQLGRGAFGASARLLERADVLTAAIGSGQATSERGSSGGESTAVAWTTSVRSRLRWEWVRAELGLYTQDLEAAVRHSRAASELIEGSPAPMGPRHRIKTDLIAAATSAATGDLAAASRLGRWCGAEAESHGLAPLHWAALSLLAGVDPDPGWAARRDEVQRELAVRGMPFVPGPQGR